MLPWHEAEPSAQVPRAPERRGIFDGGDQGGCIEHADAGDRDKPALGIVLARQFDELAAQGLDPRIKRSPLGTGIGDELMNAGGEFLMGIGQQFLDRQFQLAHPAGKAWPRSTGSRAAGLAASCGH